MSDSTPRQRRARRSPSPAVYKLDEDNGDAYEVYVPVAQRREAKLAKLSALSSTSDARKKAREQLEELLEKEDAEREEERRRERERKERTLLLEAQDVHSRKAAEGASPPRPLIACSCLPSRCNKDRSTKGRRGRRRNPRFNS
jgi:ATP-dependent RNA helicase DDX41